MDHHNKLAHRWRHTAVCKDCKARVDQAYPWNVESVLINSIYRCTHAMSDWMLYKSYVDNRQTDMSQDRNSAWSLTLFNNEWKDFQHPSWTLEGQEELCPATGKLHYQGMLHTGQVRFSAVKKVFPKAHIEPCRDPVALKKYVHKAATRAAQPTRTGRTMNRDKFFADVFEHMWNSDADHMEEDIKTDRHCNLLLQVVEQMLMAGGDWSYSYMAMNPQTKQLWERFRNVYYTSWREEYENNIAGGQTEDADDNSSVEQDSSGEMGREHQQAEIEVCSSESEEDEGGEDDSDGVEDAEDGDRESDQGDGGD